MLENDLYILCAQYLCDVTIKQRRRSHTPATLNKKFAGLFKKVEREMLKQVRESGKANTLGTEVSDILITSVITESFTEFDSILLDAITASIAEPILTPAQSLADQSFNASKATLNRMTGDVSKVLSEAYEQGLGTKETARLLGEAFEEMKEHELERIAITEVNGAQNKNQYEQVKAARVPYHQWITTQLSNVRETHQPLHGEIVRVGERFSNGLLYPGDRSGPIAEWINCRCVARPYIMPQGKAAPPGRTYFFEYELISIAA